MASGDPCLVKLITEFGEKLTKGDAEELLKRLRKRKRELLERVDQNDPRSRFQLSDLQAANKAVEEEVEKVKIAKAINERNRILNRRKRLERTQWLTNTFGTRLTEGLETMLVGINKLVPEARFSVMNQQHTLVGTYFNGLYRDLNNAGAWELFRSGTMENEFAAARFALGKKDEKALAKLPKQAVEMANIIDKWQEAMRLELNSEGAYIGKLHDFIAKTHHDGIKITRMGEERWTELARQHFDIKRMLKDRAQDPKQVDEMLASLYLDLSSGNHTKFAEHDDPGARYKGPSNLARNLSESRTVHFKSGESWVAYNREAGFGTLHEAVFKGFMLSAKKLGLLKALGTNPHSMLEDIIRDAELSLKDKAAKGTAAERETAKKELQRWQDNQHKLNDQWMAAVDGTIEQVGNRNVAQRMADLRGFVVLAKLPAMLASQLNDLATLAMAARYRNKNFVQGLSDGFKGIFRSVNKSGRREDMAASSLFFDSMAGNLGRQGSLSDLGKVSSWVGNMMRYNGAGAGTERLQQAAMSAISGEMAAFRNLVHAKLPEHYANILKQYGIDAKRWEGIRKATPFAAKEDGRFLVEPERIKDLPDEYFEDLVRDKIGGDKPIAKALIDRERRDLELRLRGYLIDQMDYSVISPDAKTRGYIYAGTKGGTAVGETIRAIMQFKGYSSSYTQRVLGREIYGRGANEAEHWYQALFHGNGELQGVAAAFLSATVFGYGSLELHNFLKNETPEDLSDPTIALKTFIAAAFQGGGLGVYGDAIFGRSGFGGGAIEQIAGPLATGLAAPVLDLLRKSYNGELPTNWDVQLTKLAVANTPYANFPFVRWGLDYFILNDLYEWMNPGYIRRTERRMQQKTGQEFLVEPR